MPRLKIWDEALGDWVYPPGGSGGSLPDPITDPVEIDAGTTIGFPAVPALTIVPPGAVDDADAKGLLQIKSQGVDTDAPLIILNVDGDEGEPVVIISDVVLGTVLKIYSNGDINCSAVTAQKTSSSFISFTSDGTLAIDPGDGFDPLSITSSGQPVFMVRNDGSVEMPLLPTSNPGGTGRLWNSGGTLKIT